MLTRSTLTLILPRCGPSSSGGRSGSSGVGTMLPGGGGVFAGEEGIDGGVGGVVSDEEELAGSLGFGCAHGGRSGLSCASAIPNKQTAARTAATETKARGNRSFIDGLRCRFRGPCL